MNPSVPQPSPASSPKPAAPARLAPSIRELLRTRRHVILCCDCEGTHDELARMTRAIERTGVAVNYFFVGDTALMHSALVRHIAESQQCESHTMAHSNLRRLSKAAQRRSILDGRRAVERIIGRPTRGFRAPYHFINRHTVQVLNEEGFVFDASRLYFRYLSMGGLHEVTPTWFREWMPTYGRLGIRPRTAFGLFRWLVRLRRVCVLPAHPQYSGMNRSLASAFEGFLQWAVDRGVVFWPIDKWLYATRGVPLPEWVSPLGPELARHD